MTQDKPTHYTRYEGGPWIDWDKSTRGNSPFHSVKFESGAIFDVVNGWREPSPKPDTDRRVPLYPETTAEPTQPLETIKSNDYRIVTRGMLEECFKALEAEYLLITTGQGAGATIHQIIPLLEQLKDALATEKKQSQETVTRPVCSSYHSMALNGKCQNCGNLKEFHE